MSDEQTRHWILRCAERIQRRYPVALDEALELAVEMYRRLGGKVACPERTAEQLLPMPA